MIYPASFEEKTGFNKIREIVKTFCQYEPGKDAIDALAFTDDMDDAGLRLSMVEEFRQIIISGTVFPVEHYFDLSKLLHRARIEGSWIEEEEVAGLRKALDSARNVLGFFKKDNENQYPALRVLAKELKYFPVITDRIALILGKTNRIRDNASPELNRIRQALASMEADISKKLNRVLKSAQSQGWIEEDASLAVRNGRPVIPITAVHKRKIRGYIHDESATGKTVYIEPAEVVEANNELRELGNEEKREVIRILTEFTNFIRPYIPELFQAHEFFAALDSIRARARFALDINAIKPIISKLPELAWHDAIHPLLFLTFRSAGKKSEVVPLSIRLDQKDRILLISGPNAGGKSVCLQTVGLLQYMFQCGFLVPVAEGSVFGFFRSIFIDIGDEQSIENDLSTYSSHLVNMKYFLRNSTAGTLVLIDEFGTGTEPMLGGAIAEAVLERLNQQGCSGVITTHYTNLKHFGASADGIINGAMLFDNHNMQPLFKLDIGRPGSSFAFEIARKIGLPEEVLTRAQDSIGQDHIDFDRHLKDVLRDKKYWENKRQKIRVSEKRLSELVKRYETELQDTEKLKKVILKEAKQKADDILSGVNRQIESTIREIREAEAEKQKTKEARQKLENMRQDLERMDTDEKDTLRKKMEELKFREEKPHIKRILVRHNTAKEEAVDKSITPGSYVIMKGTENAGEVLGIKGKKISVAFGTMKTVVESPQLEKISAQKYREITRRVQTSYTPPTFNTGERRLHFRPEIDLRGKRGEEAIGMVTLFIDEAIMVQSGELRILHGKGNGILREMIRQYLSAVDVVSWFGDEQIELGGAGVTVVRLDRM